MFDRILNSIKSIGDRQKHSLSTPVFDGAFKPNSILEQAEILIEREGLEDLVLTADGRLLAACGHKVLEIGTDGEAAEVAHFEHPVSALAALPDGSIAVGLGNCVVTGIGTASQHKTHEAQGKPFVAVTALAPTADGGLLVCDASSKYGVADWARDLMGKQRNGRLVRMDPATGEATTLATGLAYAYGALEHADGTKLVSETWAHRVTRVGEGLSIPAISDLPGYPSRFAADGAGGFWLTLFSGRTQLVEFVLTEDAYRQEMMRTIKPEYWVGPAFSSGADFLEPLQGGGVKQMGILKPWAPPRSYGLVVHYDAELKPEYSFHSRVGGRNHGICAIAQKGDVLYILSKGAGRILTLSAADARAKALGGQI
jgi:sugar lactone lactonase YvrE